MTSIAEETARSSPDPEPADLRETPTPAPAGRKWSRYTVALIAILFIFGPNAVRLVGVEPTAIENRALRPFPDASAGWDFLPEFDAWAVDQLPLRDKAVEADRTVVEKLYGELPNRSGQERLVVSGSEGWLFLANDMKLRCKPSHSLEQAWEYVDRVAAMVESVGGRFVLLIPPDKSSLENDRLPSTYPRRGCSVDADQAFWQRVSEQPPTGYVDLREPLRQVKAEQGQAYFRTDTHWLPRGAAEFTRTLVAAIDPKVPTTDLVSVGAVTQKTDLSALAGQPGSETSEGFQARRAGVNTVRTDKVASPLDVRFRTTPTAGATRTPLVRQKTLLIGDSFAQSAFGMFPQYFSELNFVHCRHLDETAAYTAQQIATSPVVVMEMVQRELQGGFLPIVTDAGLDQLEREMAKYKKR